MNIYQVFLQEKKFTHMEFINADSFEEAVSIILKWDYIQNQATLTTKDTITLKNGNTITITEMKSSKHAAKTYAAYLTKKAKTEPFRLIHPPPIQ